MAKKAKPIPRLTDEQRKIVEDNIRLAYKFVSQHNYKGFEEDILQTAIEGLCIAVAKHDKTKGKLSTVSYLYMMSTLKDFFRHNGVNLITDKTTLQSLPLYSLDSPIQNSNTMEETNNWHDLYTMDESAEDGFRRVEDIDFANASIEKIKTYLKEDEFELLMKYINGEIVRNGKYNKDLRKCKNIMQRIRMRIDRERRYCG